MFVGGTGVSVGTGVKVGAGGVSVAVGAGVAVCVGNTTATWGGSVGGAGGGSGAVHPNATETRTAAIAATSRPHIRCGFMITMNLPAACRMLSPGIVLLPSDAVLSNGKGKCPVG